MCKKFTKNVAPCKLDRIFSSLIKTKWVEDSLLKPDFEGKKSFQQKLVLVILS